MGTERFTLHRPGKHRNDHNVNYIAGEMVSEEGVSRIALAMVGRDVEGEITTVRIAETPKSTEFFHWNEKSGWEEADTDGGIMKIVYEAWCNGELE